MQHFALRNGVVVKSIRITQDQWAQIGDLLFLGWSHAEIATAVGCSTRPVQDYVSKWGRLSYSQVRRQPGFRPSNPLVSTEELQVIGDLLVSGYSYQQIAKRIGRSTRPVQDYVRQYGRMPYKNLDSQPNRSPRHLTAVDREQISRGLLANKTISSIAAELGKHKSTVCREIARNGGKDAYRVVEAEYRACVVSKRPKAYKLANPKLC